MNNLLRESSAIENMVQRRRTAIGELDQDAFDEGKATERFISVRLVDRVRCGPPLESVVNLQLGGSKERLRFACLHAGRDAPLLRPRADIIDLLIRIGGERQHSTENVSGKRRPNLLGHNARIDQEDAGMTIRFSPCGYLTTMLGPPTPAV